MVGWCWWAGVEPSLELEVEPMYVQEPGRGPRTRPAESEVWRGEMQMGQNQSYALSGDVKKCAPQNEEKSHIRYGTVLSRPPQMSQPAFSG